MADPDASSRETSFAVSGADLADDVAAASDVVSSVRENVERVIVGNQNVIEHVLTAVLARGHVLLEDVPGVGKTTLARAIARSFEGEFKRIQFTPDILPADVTGVNVYNKKRNDFEFRHGPVFGNVVLGDEINRAPPKAQSALLEAMEEAQVTVDGETRALPNPFTVIATQNTVASDHVYDLPMAELDRFTKRLRFGYPDAAEEIEMLDRVIGDHPIESLDPVVTLGDLRAARSTTAEITVVEDVRSYATGLANFTREHARIGLSPRGTLHLLRSAQARAVIDGRDYVVPDDVKTEAPVVIPHRIRTGGERSADELVAEALSAVDPE